MTSQLQWTRSLFLTKCLRAVSRVVPDVMALDLWRDRHQCPQLNPQDMLRGGKPTWRGRRTDESPAISQMEVSVGISHPIDSVLLSYPPACLYFQLLGAN